VLLLSDKAKAPTKGSAFAAGHDLYSARDIVIPARGRARVDTDISISVPVGTCTFFDPTSSPSSLALPMEEQCIRIIIGEQILTSILRRPRSSSLRSRR
jgi:hypothetical protein